MKGDINYKSIYSDLSTLLPIVKLLNNKSCAITLEVVGVSVYLLSYVAQDLKLQMFVLLLPEISSSFNSSLSADGTDFQEHILMDSQPQWKVISQSLGL